MVSLLLIFDRWVNTIVSIFNLLGHMRHNIVVFLFLFIQQAGYTQPTTVASINPEIIKIDSVSFRANKRIPFDRPFNIHLDVSADYDIHNIFLYDTALETDSQGNSVRVLKGSSGSGIAPRYELPYKLEGKVLVIEVKQLPPNRNFDIVVVRKLSGKEMLAALKVFYLLKDNDEPAAQQIFDTELSRRVLEKTPPGIAAKNYYNGSFNYFKTISWTKIKSYLQAIQSQPDAKKFKASIAEIDFPKVHDELKRTGHDSISLALLYAGQVDKIALEYLNGNKALSVRSKNLTPDHDFGQRIANIDQSIAEIGNFKVLANVLLMRYPDDQDYKDFMSSLGTIEGYLVTSKKKIEKYSPTVVGLIKSDTQLIYGKLLVVTSGMETIKTATTFSFLPEVGMCLAFPYGREGIQYIPRMYFGVNIYPRPIDKEIPFADVPGYAKFWYRFSVSVGVTATGMNDPDFDDVFNKTSMLMGFNFRIYRGLRFSAGPMLYRQKFTNPIVSQHRLTVAPFAGFSLDVDIASAFEKLIGKF
jgi:hypothetical protein